MSKTIAIIGECMAELSQLSFEPGKAPVEGQLGYGGDTLNSAIYMAREGLAPSYVSALGDDQISQWMLACWQEEGIGCSLVYQRPGAVPGLYMIQTDDCGERHFSYWRKGSPASRLFDDADQRETLFKQLEGFDYLFLSGISLAILSREGREALLNFLQQYRERGGRVVFDGNYRPQLWSSPEETQRCYAQMYANTDIALSTLDDELALHPMESADQVRERIQAAGVAELVLKLGPEGCEVFTAAATCRIGTTEVKAIDTTAAGDSFNAGYLSARLQGEAIEPAGAVANRLAAQVVQHRGAIVPRDLYISAK